MDRLLPLVMVWMLLPACGAAQFRIEQLQGAWWSDFQNPTADFSIRGNEVWLDSDAEYHACRIEGDILIFELSGSDEARSRIVDLQGDRLVLETPDGGSRRALTRAKE